MTRSKTSSLPQLPIRQNLNSGSNSPPDKYYNDPARYAEEKLHVKLWSKQIEILQALLKPPYRVLVKSAHSVGKTFASAVAVNWWYDTRNPGVAITTAPTARDVRDLLWKEIRILRMRRQGGGFSGNSAPLLQDAPDHYAKGFTAERGESFQGRHDKNMLFVFDEAIGIESIFWETTKTMFKPEAGHAWLAIFNPTDTTKQAYIEENSCDRDGKPLWTVITMSALDHPNITDQLAGKSSVPYPAAVSLAQIDEAIAVGATPLLDGSDLATDIEWHPGSGQWFRPGPVVESRWLGRWPSAGTMGVWSDALWMSVIAAQLDEPLDVLPRIGCDVARYGDDMTAMHCRRGHVSLHHESHNGWSVVQTIGRLKQLAREMAQRVNWQRNPMAKLTSDRDIPILVDDDGVGGGVSDGLAAGGYTVRPIRAGTIARTPSDYPNLRSQLWFDAAERARQGRLSLHLLPRDVLQKLKQQVMAPTWKLDSEGRRVVEPKAETKKKIGRSPDDADAFNLAYHEPLTTLIDPMQMEKIDKERRAGYNPLEPPFRDADEFGEETMTPEERRRWEDEKSRGASRSGEDPAFTDETPNMPHHQRRGWCGNRGR